MSTRLQIIENNDTLPTAWLEAFKQYASVPDDGRDALLLGLLRSAIYRVQEYADRALLKCRVRQTGEADAKTGQIRLYLVRLCPPHTIMAARRPPIRKMRTIC